MLGVAPIRGRQFTREDTLPGAEDVAVLSSELWRSAFGGDEGGRRARGPDRRRADAHRRHHAAGLRRPRPAGAGLAAVDDRSGEPWRPRRALPLPRRPSERRRQPGAGEGRARIAARQVAAAIGAGTRRTPRRTACASMGCRTTSSAASARRSGCCRARWASCCSSRAPTWPTSCSPAPSRASASSRSARRSAPDAGGCCGNS